MLKFLSGEGKEQALKDANAMAQLLQEKEFLNDPATLQALAAAMEKDGVPDAKARVARFLKDPNTLLFGAAAFTLMGNVAYVGQYAQAAMQADTSADATLNALHALIFCSFTLEKLVDISKSSFVGYTERSHVESMDRRQWAVKTADWLKHNYPLAAGAWLSTNQLLSGTVFGVQGALQNNEKHLTTAGFRGLAMAASVGMTLYKYHSLLAKEEAEGVSLIDPRVRAYMEPIDKLFGNAVRMAGDYFPYMAAAALTAPHVSIFLTKLTDEKQPSVSYASVSTAIGYACFVAYLASGRKSPSTAEPEDVVDAVQKQQATLDRLSAATAHLMGKLKDTTQLNTAQLSEWLQHELHMQPKNAQTMATTVLTQAYLASKDGMTNADLIATHLLDAVAQQQVEVLWRELPASAGQTANKEALVSGLRNCLLQASLSQVTELAGVSVTVEAPVISRRTFLGGLGL